MTPHLFAYLDNIITVSKTFEEHIECLKRVFDRLKEAKLRPNPEKC